MKIGIIYASMRMRKKKATYKVGCWLKEFLEEKGNEVVLGYLDEFQDFNCDGFIIGAAVYSASVEKTGILKFLEHHYDELQGKPLATYILHHNSDPQPILATITKALPSEPQTQANFKGYRLLKKDFDIVQKNKANDWINDIQTRFSAAS